MKVTRYHALCAFRNAFSPPLKPARGEPFHVAPCCPRPPISDDVAARGAPRPPRRRVDRDARALRFPSRVAAATARAAPRVVVVVVVVVVASTRGRSRAVPRWVRCVLYTGPHTTPFAW